MKAKTFKGGIHPHDHKYLSNNETIAEFPEPNSVIIHLSQHIGAPAKPIVKPGDEVKKGQIIAEANGFVSVPMHSSVSGKVKKIANFPHPTGSMQMAVQIENNGKSEWVEKFDKENDYQNLNSADIKDKIKNAGICGMGGAGFPTHVKLSPPDDKPIDTVIINGVECEPYLTADHRLMLEKVDEIITGLKIIMKTVNAKQGMIGIEVNKPDAIKLMRSKLIKEKDIKVIPLKLRYPQGAEKQLIYAATKRKVPAGGLPMDIGVVVQNVGTAHSIYEAVKYEKPLIERITTITGKIVKSPKNLKVPIGSLISDMLDYCGGTKEEIGKLISGGPMMGFALSEIETPITKTSSGILFMGKDAVDESEEKACLRCGRCVDACPMKLTPTFIADAVKNQAYEEAKKLGCMDCMECGSCAYVCPSHISLVQWIKLGKLEISKLED